MLALGWSLAKGEIVYTVRANFGLDSVASHIKADPNVDAYAVVFSTYLNVGVFDLNGPAAATSIQFRREKVSDQVIDFGTTAPLIRVRNWKGELRLTNLAFLSGGGSAVLIDGYAPATPLGSLILDSCVVFGPTMNSNLIQWTADTAGKRIEIKRSHIVANRGASSVITLQAPIIAFHNNVLNFSGIIRPTASQDFIFSANTACRVQVNADGSLGSATYHVVRNMVTFLPGQNYLGSTPGYFMAVSNFNSTGSVLARNRLYNNWAGFDYQANTLFAADTSNRSITPYLQPDTNELWNWSLGRAEDTAHGFLGPDSARPDPYNEFPGDYAKIVVLNGSNTFFFFQPSLIPRTLREALSGDVSPSLAFPYHRFVWPNLRALQLGGPFQLDSLRVQVTNQDGYPVLLAKGDTGGFVSQAEGQLVPAPTSGLYTFQNGLSGAVQYHPAFRCNTRIGQNFSPAYDSFYQPKPSLDTLSFGSIDQPGLTRWTTSSPLDTSTLPANLRFLGNTVGYFTTAVPTPGSKVRIGARPVMPPWRSDSVKWQDKITTALFAARPVGAIYMDTMPAATSFTGYLVERLSVPRGNSIAAFRFPWGFAKARSNSGFQFQLDTSARAVDTNAFAFVSQTVGLQWQGRGAGTQDSVWLEAHVMPDLELWKIQGSNAPVQVLTAIRMVDSVKYAVPLSDSGAAFFSGLSLNIPGGISFNGLVNGFRVENLLTSTSAKLELDTLTASYFDTVSVARNKLFLGGVSVFARRLDLKAPNTTYALKLGIPKPLDSSNVRVWVYSSALGWQPDTAFTLLPGPADSIRIRALDSSMTQIVVLETIGAPGVITADPLVPVIVGAQADVSFVNTVSGSTRINGYKVQAVSVGQDGVVNVVTDTLRVLTDHAKLTVSTNAYHAFTARYYITDTLAGILALSSPAGLMVNKAIQEAAHGPTLARGWQLVGLPFDGPVDARFQVPPPVSKDTVDRHSIFRLMRNGANYAWDSMPRPDTVQLRRGAAVLFGGTRACALTLDTSVTADLNPFSFTGTAAAEWRLIADPFPFPVRASKLVSNLGSLSQFRQLTYFANLQSRNYQWSAMSPQLEPFTGYAYFLRAGETLTLDPLAGVALGKSAATGTGAVVRAEMDGGAAELRLFPRGLDADIPALPAPGAALDIRAGSGFGFWSRGVDWNGFVEPLILQAPGAGEISVTASLENFAPGSVPEFALWDSLSGIGYIGDELRKIPVSAGENRFALLGGSPGFARGKLGRLRGTFAADGSFTALVAQGALRLRWNLPPRAGGYDRLEIGLYDMQGRRMLRRSFGRVSAGTWKMTAALPGTGFYFCRAQAYAGGIPVFSRAGKVAAP